MLAQSMTISRLRFKKKLMYELASRKVQSDIYPVISRPTLSQAPRRDLIIDRCVRATFSRTRYDHKECKIVSDVAIPAICKNERFE